MVITSQNLGYVYFICAIRDRSRCKIGFSKNPLKRLQQLQTGSELKLEIVHIITCYKYSAKIVEKRLHSMLALSRRRGEWFEMYPEKLDWLCSYSFDYELYGLDK